MNLIELIGPGEFWSLVCALLWAVAVILFRRAGTELPPVTLNLVKNGIGASLMLITVLLFGVPWPSMPMDAVLLALLSGVLGIGVGDSLYFRALNRIGAARMGVAQSTYSPFVILLSVLFLGERLSAAQWSGVVLVLAGVTLVSLQRNRDDGPTEGLASGMLTGAASVFVMALAIVIAKPLLMSWDFLWIVLLRSLAGVGSMLLLLMLRGEIGGAVAAVRRVQRWPTIVAGAVIGSYLSMLAWLAGYKYAQASIAAVLNELASVFIVLLAALILREALSRRLMLGSAMAFAGVVAVVSL